MRQRGSPRSTTFLALLLGAAGLWLPMPQASAASSPFGAVHEASVDRGGHVAIGWPEALPLSSGPAGPSTDDSSGPREARRTGRQGQTAWVERSTATPSIVDAFGFGARLLGLATAPATGPPTR